MIRVAIYDKFYKTESPFIEYGKDAVSIALDRLPHHVVGTSTTMREAVSQIIGFTTVSEQPDIMILGGMLDDDSTYKEHPYAVHEPCDITRRNLFGGRRVKPGQKTTYMLPQFDHQDGTYHFPSVVSTGRSKAEMPEALLNQWRHAQIGIAARVLSRIAESCLPNTKRIGISSDPMFDSVLHAEVRRTEQDAAQRLYEHLVAHL